MSLTMLCGFKLEKSRALIADDMKSTRSSLIKRHSVGSIPSVTATAFAKA